MSGYRSVLNRWRPDQSKRGGKRNAARRRRGAVLVLFAFFVLVMVALLALAIDLAYIMEVDAEAQTCADSAALAGAWELLHPDRFGPVPDSTEAIANARTQAVAFAASNEIAKVVPAVDRNDANDPQGEIVVGFLPTWGYQNYPWEYGDPNRFNSVRVHVQRSEARNGPLGLIFGGALGRPTTEVHAVATAIIEVDIVGVQPTEDSGPTSLMPFAIDRRAWEEFLDKWEQWKTSGDQGDLPDDYAYQEDQQQEGAGTVSEGADQIPELRLYPFDVRGQSGNDIPGNFGTVDICSSNNSAQVLKRRIEEGVSYDDLACYPDHLYNPSSAQPIVTEGDTGLSAGIEDSLEAIIGQPRTVLLYESVVEQGNRATFEIVGLVGIRIMAVELGGAFRDKHVTVQPALVIDDAAVPGPDPGDVRFVVRPPRLIE